MMPRRTPARGRRGRGWLGLILLAGVGLTTAARAQTAAPDAATVRLDPGDPSADSNTDGARESATALAKKLQNPIADMISIPFQNNTNFSYGPNHGTQNILNIQPVVPVHLNSDWNLITRTILPLIWQPSLQPAETVPFGLGPTTFSAFFSPRAAVGGWVWGVGSIIQIPTITNKTLGSNVWGAGPAAVAVHTGGPWVYGALINNVFSLGGSSGPGGTRYSLFTLNPFANYNFGGGWFVGSAPIITANWFAAGNNAWTLPIGAQVGRLIKVGGKLPVNMVIGAYYNALRPQFGSTWQLRAQVAVIF